MTPKEKAINLVNNYLCIDEIYNVDLFCDECGISNDAAKYCALIAVDEMISVLPFTAIHRSLNEYAIQMHKYLEKVKEEIEKL
jgi:hypothetical protein